MSRLLDYPIIMPMQRRLIFVFIIGLSCITSGPTSAQTEVAPCGYVDGFDFPLAGVDTEKSDFGIYRTRFGGLHTGIDIGFHQYGDPVRAAARGRVTYSNPEGWDTEKGVVVIQHTFPDGTLVNTLYGHMEEVNGYHFPTMNQCVEQGQIIGAIGDPSLSLPHLHYEVRTRYRHEGGPGYTEINPIDLGWLHPIDFTFLAKVWIHPAYRGHFSLSQSPTIPPVVLPNGTYLIAQSTRLENLSADGQMLWQFDTLSSIIGLLVLPDGRILASTSSAQALVLNNGSYSTLWATPESLAPPILLGSGLVFLTEENTIAAYTPDGSQLWQTTPLPDRLIRWAVSGDRLAVSTRSGDLWIVDAAGSVLFQTTYTSASIPFTAAEGEFLVLTGSVISRIDSHLNSLLLVNTEREVTAEAEILYSTDGTFYFYTGEGRSLYAYNFDGSLRWIAYLPGSHLHAPRLGIGGGSLLYALSTDGQLLAYDTTDGHLIAQLALYNGGIDGSASVRWLNVGPDDTIRFSSGYLTVVRLDGLALNTVP